MVTHHFVLAATMWVVAGAPAFGQRAPIAITDVTVVDGTGSPGRPHATVVISGGKIVAGDSGSRAIVFPEANVHPRHLSIARQQPLASVMNAVVYLGPERIAACHTPSTCRRRSRPLAADDGYEKRTRSA